MGVLPHRRPWFVSILAIALLVGAGSPADAQRRSSRRSTPTAAAARSRAVQRQQQQFRPTARPALEQHLQGMAAKLAAYGIGKSRASLVAEHVALGMPTQAGRSDPNDYLLARNGYVVGYSRDLVAPRWVAWKLTKANLNPNYVRKDHFRPDATLPKGWPRASSSDYKRSGYTRGHMVASGERSGNARANEKTFVYTNVLPQAEKNNAGPWNHFEHYYRDLAADGHDVYVMAGGVYGANPSRIGNNQVAVPDATWKVAVILEKGQTIHDINENTRIISIVVPNENQTVRIGHNWDRYRVTAKQIQDMTGTELLTSLPAPLRTTLLNKMDKAAIPAPQLTRDWQVRAVAAEQRSEARRQAQPQGSVSAPTAP